MDHEARLKLLHEHPERYATSGLDWGNPAHYRAMEHGLLQVLMTVLAKRQCRDDQGARQCYGYQQGRIEQRLSVVERAACRKGVGLMPPVAGNVVIFGLEKMADALEEGAGAWAKRDDGFGYNTLAGIMLGTAVGFSASIREMRAYERFSVGPFGGLSKIGAMLTRPDVAVEMEDLPQLEVLVQKAREIPVGHVVVHANESCAAFYVAFDAMLAKLQKRDLERDWN